MPYKEHPTDPDKLVYVPRQYNLPKEWEGITEDEFSQMLIDAGFTRTDLMMLGACVDDICKMVEARLKEKNHG